MEEQTKVAVVAKFEDGAFFLEIAERFIQELNKNGVDATMVAGGTAQFPYHRLPWHRKYPLSIFDDFLMGFSVSNFADDFRIIQTDSPAVILAWRKKVGQKLVYVCINPYIAQPNGLTLKERVITSTVHKFLESVASKKADVLVVLTPSLKKFFRANPPQAVIPLGVDTEIFRPRSGRKEDEVCNLCFVGRITQQKGIDTLLTAIRILLKRGYAGRFKLNLVGPISDVEVPDGASHGSKKSGTVNFLGALPHREIPDFLRQQDIFVFPSRAESQGLALVEAMSCGLPSVATRIGGIMDIIEDGKDGFLIEPNNPIMLKERLAFLIDNAEGRMKMGRDARAKAIRNYAWPVVAKQFASLYSKL